MLDGVRRDSNHPSCKDVRQKVFFSFNKYEMADEDEEIDCEIRGVMN
jgi:DNA-binding cell septation regulator SpoVG